MEDCPIDKAYTNSKKSPDALLKTDVPRPSVPKPVAKMVATLPKNSTPLSEPPKPQVPKPLTVSAPKPKE